MLNPEREKLFIRIENNIRKLQDRSMLLRSDLKWKGKNYILAQEKSLPGMIGNRKITYQNSKEQPEATGYQDC